MRASNNPVQEINWEPIASRGCPILSDTRAREEQGLWHSRWQAVVRLVPKSTYSTYRCSSSSHHCVHGSGRDGQGIRREGADSAARSETDSREPAIAHYRDPDRVDTNDQPPALKINQENVRWEDLETRLAEIYLKRAEKVAFVRGDADVDFQYVADVIDVAHHAGVERIGLLTKEQVLAGE